MPTLAQIALLLATLFAASAAAFAPPPAKPKEKARIEFRWLENSAIQGVTEEKGIRTTCGDELSYPHSKPVLTNVDVAGTRLTNTDFSRNGLSGDHFMVHFQLTKEARERLVKSCGNARFKVLGVFVDGKYWSAWNFQPQKPNDFEPSAGFISSRAEAERIMAACK